MNKFNKLYIAIFLSIFTILNLALSPISFSYEKELFSYENIKTIAPNTTHRTMYKMTDVGWMKINIITADLGNKYVDSTVLIPKYISQKKPLSELAQSQKNIVAAINGDFFDTTGNSTLGIVIKDGKYITSSIYDNRFFNYLKLKDGRSFISKIKGSSMKLKNLKSSVDITYKNKPYLAYNRAIIFDRHWDKKSIGNTCLEDVVELVIVDNQIHEIRYNKPPISIPENGYIVSAVGSSKDNILSNFKVLDIVTISGESFLNDIENAIGGGANIVYNGKVIEDFSLDISGRHPRSALGFSKDNKTLYLLTVDGRNNKYTGMTQTELAYIMLDIGAYNAINLDGGGSSEMLALSDNQILNIVNTPSDGRERPIHNGIGIINNAPIGNIKEIKLYADTNKTFVNMPIKINYIAYDDSGHILDINPEDITWTISGVNCIKDNNIFTPQTSGIAKIRINIHGITSSTEIKVLDFPSTIKTNPTSTSLKLNEKLKISIIGADDEGYFAPIPMQMVHKTYTGVLGEFNNDIFTPTSEGQGLLTFSFQGALTQLPIGVGTQNMPIYDFEQKKGVFSSYPPSTVSGNYTEMDFSYNDTNGGVLNYDFTKDSVTRAAYAEFEDNEIPIPENCSALNLNVYGDYGNNHQLRAKIKDKNGKIYTIDFARYIDWNGWKKVTAHIPNRVNPICLKSIYIVETDKNLQDKGVIGFDDLSADVKISAPIIEQSQLQGYKLNNVDANTADLAMLSTYVDNDYLTVESTDTFNSTVDTSSVNSQYIQGSNPIPTSSLNLIGKDTIILKQEESYVEDMPKTIVEQYPYLNIPNTIKGNINVKCSDKKFIYDTTKFETIFLKNDNGFLSRTNEKTGWSKLLSYRDKKYDKPLVLILEIAPWFKNPLDTRLFYETIENIKNNENRVILIYPDNVNSIAKEDGVTHIRYDKKDTNYYLFDLDTTPISVNLANTKQ